MSAIQRLRLSSGHRFLYTEPQRLGGCKRAARAGGMCRNIQTLYNSSRGER